ncbi:hypothetical protein EBR96_01970 [bacterium]|nr:hypothetical protein [bacterium]
MYYHSIYILVALAPLQYKNCYVLRIYAHFTEMLEFALSVFRSASEPERKVSVQWFQFLLTSQHLTMNTWTQMTAQSPRTFAREAGEASVTIRNPSQFGEDFHVGMSVRVEPDVVTLLTHIADVVYSADKILPPVSFTLNIDNADLGIHLSDHPVGLSCPIGKRENRFQNSAIDFLKATIKEYIPSEPEKRASAAATDFGKLASYFFPDLDEENLKTAALWLLVLFRHDDACDNKKSLLTLKEVDELSDSVFNLLKGTPVLDTSEENPKYAHVIQLTRFMAERLSHVSFSAKTQFLRHVQDYLDYTKVEKKDENPDVDKYRANRPYTSAVYTCLSLSSMLRGEELNSQEISIAKKLGKEANQSVWASNDLFSLQRETAKDGHALGAANHVLILMNNEGMSAEEAIERTKELHEQACANFVLLIDKYKPQLHGKVVGVRPEIVWNLMQDAAAMIRGNVDYSIECARYGLNGTGKAELDPISGINLGKGPQEVTVSETAIRVAKLVASGAAAA